LNPEPSVFKGHNRPVERVSWFEAVEFCDRLTKLTHRPYRLPSEAEWEYACRAGTTTPFNFGPTISTSIANYRGTNEVRGNSITLGSYRDGPEGIYRGETTEVTKFLPNGNGLYDMHGNVWEWCHDHWHLGYENAPIDGSAWLENDANENTYRSIRGGSHNFGPQICRSAFRSPLFPHNPSGTVGFRVLCSLLSETMN
jgi:formylglycine-generating enzyme required for sulfatase activity